MSIYLNISNSRVGMNKNLFYFLSKSVAIKTAGSAQKIRVGRVSRNTAIFSALIKKHYCNMAITILNSSKQKARQQLLSANFIMRE